MAASGPGRRASASPAATQPQLHPAVVAASGPGRRASALPAATQQQRICTAERQFTRGVEMRWREGWRRLAPFRVTPSPAHVVVTVAKRHRDVSTTAPGQRCATEHTRTQSNTCEHMRTRGTHISIGCCRTVRIAHVWGCRLFTDFCMRAICL
eukprot:COSAG02_NODE_15111_length_1202_cov_21.342702_1_plen_153_part_00